MKPVPPEQWTNEMLFDYLLLFEVLDRETETFKAWTDRRNDMLEMVRKDMFLDWHREDSEQ